MTTTRYDEPRKPPANAAARARDYVRRHWRYREPAGPQAGNCCGSVSRADAGARDTPFERVLSHSLCVSAMAFQDAWNIDLERLQQCCVHVVTGDGKLIPFCAYYMTDTRGRRLKQG